MPMRGENWRFWVPVVLLSSLAAVSGQKLIRAHIDPEVSQIDYTFDKILPARRGNVYSSAAYGRSCSLVKSVPFWDYHLDPVALSNAVAHKLVRRKGEPPRSELAIVRTIANVLKLDYAKVKAMSKNMEKRYQPLALSTDVRAHDILADSHLVAGIAIDDRQVTQYLHGRSLCHILGSVNQEGVGSSGLEQQFNRELTGLPGKVKGMKDAHGRELYDRRIVSIDPVPGSDIYLTVDQNIQFEAENALKWGLTEYGAGSGWCIVMDSHTGAILAMASFPDFNPAQYNKLSSEATEKVNRAISFIYEPGSVMKVITAAAAFDSGFAKPSKVYSTDRYDERYYKLPGDGSHKWEPTMTVRDAIVHSSNIVIGKLGYDFGPVRLYAYMKKFGFGAKTGIELPGEQYGILPNPSKRPWDKASQSRAAIGQFVAVTGIQLVGAYQAIANDGLRLRPHIIERIVASDGHETYAAKPEPLGRPISVAAARTMREVMLDVASPKGTARRAAICGYSVAGKTGTAQKALNGHYQDGLYRASFCGIVPSGTVEGHPSRFVVLVTLDFDARTKFHQGGNSAGPVFKRIATAALRYLMVAPDRPEEMDDFGSADAYDKALEDRALQYDAQNL